MQFHRELLGTYLLTMGGLLIGILVGVLVLDTDPAFQGWLFGAGLGLSGGAFVAALASNVPLVGRPRAARNSDD